MAKVHIMYENETNRSTQHNNASSSMNNNNNNNNTTTTNNNNGTVDTTIVVAGNNEVVPPPPSTGTTTTEMCYSSYSYINGQFYIMDLMSHVDLSFSQGHPNRQQKWTQTLT